MTGIVSSLNAANAAATILYEIARQRILAGRPPAEPPSASLISGNGPAPRVAWWRCRYLAATPPSPAVAARSAAR